MSEAPDPLEAELASLRPQPVSPELRDRVAGRLTGRAGSRRWVWGLAVIGVLAVGVALVLGPPRKKEPPVPTPPVVQPATPTQIPSPDPAPSVLAYQQALARSPEELTALLNKHAATAQDTVPVAAFNRSDTTFKALIGDE